MPRKNSKKSLKKKKSVKKNSNSLEFNVNLENRQHYMSDFGLDVFATPQIDKMGVAVNF